MRFEWNQTKAASNQQKHGVSFEEAFSIFYDEQGQMFHDEGHMNEPRFLMLGMSYRLRVLVVSFCERGNGEVLRIISARKATRREAFHYRARL